MASDSPTRVHSHLPDTFSGVLGRFACLQSDSSAAFHLSQDEIDSFLAARVEQFGARRVSNPYHGSCRNAVTNHTRIPSSTSSTSITKPSPPPSSAVSPPSPPASNPRLPHMDSQLYSPCSDTDVVSYPTAPAPRPTFDNPSPSVPLNSMIATSTSTWIGKRKAIPPPRAFLEMHDDDDNDHKLCLSHERVELGCGPVSNGGSMSSAIDSPPHRPSLIPHAPSCEHTLSLISERLEAGKLGTSSPPPPSSSHHHQPASCFSPGNKSGSGGGPNASAANHHHLEGEPDPITPDRIESGHGGSKGRHNLIRFRQWKTQKHLKSLSCPPVDLD